MQHLEERPYLHLHPHLLSFFFTPLILLLAVVLVYLSTFLLVVASYIVVLLVFLHPLPLAVVNLLGRHLRLWSICKEKDVSPPS